MADRVMIKPSGAVVTVPEAQLQNALGLGYKLETPEQAKQRAYEKLFGGGLPAAGLGALRGATLGLGDVALAGAGVLDPREIKARQEAAPGASLAGEIAGTVASLAVAPQASGPGLAAKVGMAGQRAALHAGAPKLVARAAGGVIEGGLWGTGAAISETAISDDPKLTAEKLFAGSGAGGLAGGAITFTGGMVGMGVRKAGGALMSKLGGQGMRVALEDFAERQTVSAYALKSDFLKGKLADQKEIGRYMLTQAQKDPEVLMALKGEPHQMVEAAGKLTRQEGARIGGVLAQVDQRAKFNMDYANHRIAAEVLDPMKGNPALRTARNEMSAVVSELAESGLPTASGGRGPVTFERAWEFQSDMLKKTGMGEPNFGIREELRKARDILREEILAQAGAVAPNFEAALQRSARDYRSAIKMRTLAEQSVAGVEGNLKISPFDYISGITGAGLGLASGNIAPIAVSAGLLGAKRYFKMHPALLAVTADRFAKSPTFNRMAATLQKTMQAGFAASPAFGGAFRQTLELAAARGALETLATHVQLARSAPDYLAAVGMQDEDPDSANLFAAKADAIEGVAALADEQDAKLDVAIERFLGKQGEIMPKVGEGLTLEKFAALHGQLMDLNANPAAAMAAFDPGDLADVAPTVAKEMLVTAQAAAQFLYAVMPKNPAGPQMLEAFAQPWEPSRYELERFSRYAGAIERPDSLLVDLKNGTLTREQVDAAQAVYPKLIADLQRRMMDRLSAYEKPLDYRQRLGLSILFGKPIGGAGDPGKLNLIQQAHAATIEAANQGPSVDGRQSVSQAKNYETQAQRIEARSS